MWPILNRTIFHYYAKGVRARMFQLPAFYNVVPGGSQALSPFWRTHCFGESPDWETVSSSLLSILDFHRVLLNTSLKSLSIQSVATVKCTQGKGFGDWGVVKTQLSSQPALPLTFISTSHRDTRFPTESENGDGERAEDKVSCGWRLVRWQNSCGSTIPQRWHRFPKELQHDAGRRGGIFFSRFIPTLPGVQ